MAQHTLEFEFEGFTEPEFKYKSVPLGHALSIRATGKVEGTVTTPTTSNVATIEEPDGTNNTPSPTLISAGIHDVSFTPDQVGWHKLTWTQSGTINVTRFSEFYVYSSGVV